MGLMDVVRPIQKPKRTAADVEAAVSDMDALKKNAKGNAKIGNDFEKELKQTLDVYEACRVAYIQKFPVNTVFVPDKKNASGVIIKKGFMIYSKKNGFDYIGGTIADSRTVMIEAKSTMDSRIDVGNEDTGIKKHQIERMLWLESETNFNIFFLWQVRKLGGIVYKFTPTQLLNAIGEKKSLTVMDCEENRFQKLVKVKYHMDNIYDFLNLLEV